MIFLLNKILISNLNNPTKIKLKAHLTILIMIQMIKINHKY